MNLRHQAYFAESAVKHAGALLHSRCRVRD